MRLWKGIVCGLALLGSCAVAPRSLAAMKTASDYNDTNLERTLRAALNRNSSLGRIEPNVLHGTVRLTGEVTHYQDKLEAEAIARQLPGIRTVQSKITLSTPVVDDAELEDQLEDRLRFARADIGLAFPHVQVETHKGLVSLSGAVKDAIEHAAVLSLVGTTDGVFSIKDELSIDPTLIDDDAARLRINKVVYRASRPRGEAGSGWPLPVRASFANGSVTLMGAVPDVKTKEELLSRLRDTQGVISVNDELIVRSSVPSLQETASHPFAPCVQNKEVANANH